MIEDVTKKHEIQFLKVGQSDQMKLSGSGKTGIWVPLAQRHWIIMWLVQKDNFGFN